MSLLLLFKSAAAPVATAEERHGGGYWMSPEEWDRYLKKFHELRREQLVLRAIRNGLREELKGLLFPTPPPKTVTNERIQEAARAAEPEKQTRIILRQEDPNYAIRLKIAELKLDLRKRMKVAKKKRRKRRDEEAILALLQ